MTAPIYTLTNGHLRFNDDVTIVPDCFSCNEAVSCDMNNVQSIGHRFLYRNESLTSIDLKQVKSIGDYFLFFNESLTSIDLKQVRSIGHRFLFYNGVLTSIDLKQVQSIGNYFLYFNEVLTSIETTSGKLRILKADNQTFVVESTKTKGEVTVHRGFILNSIQNNILNKKDCYLAIQGEYSAHGDTLKQAFSDLEAKINFEKLSKEPIKADTLITIDRYHAATGSCKTGIRNWMEVNGVKEGLKASELLPILERKQAYGLEIFKKLITF